MATLTSLNGPDVQGMGQFLGKLQTRLAQQGHVAAAKPAAFAPSFEHCEAHGQYPVNMQDADGHVRYYPAGCPTCRKHDRAVRLLRDCDIPQRFAACDFDNFETPLPAQQKILARCRDFVEHFGEVDHKGCNLILTGKPGTGKNHLVTGIVKALLEKKRTALMVKAAHFLDASWSKTFEEREGWIQALSRVDVLVLDEIGRTSNAKAAQDAFFRLIDARYEAMGSTILTTNLNREDLIETLGAAAYDRLAHGGQRLTLDWESYRGRGQA